MVSEWLSLREIFCVQFYLELPQSYLLRFPSPPTFFSVTLASESSSCFSHFVMSSACSSLSPLSLCLHCYLPKLGRLSICWNVGSVDLASWNCHGVDSGMIQQPVCSFSKKHIISRVEADLLRENKHL